MRATSNVQIILTFQDASLNDEELEVETRKLLRQLQELEEVDQVERVRDANPPEGNMSGVGALLGGILMAVVNAENVKVVLEFIWDRVRPSGKDFTLTMKANGREITIAVKDYKPNDFDSLIQKAQSFVEGGN